MIKVRRRLFRNPVATSGGKIVADIHRERGPRRWVATLRPYAGDGPDQCPAGVLAAWTLRHMRAQMEDRVNVRGEWWT